MITEYINVIEPDFLSLQREVKRTMTEGWQPLGGAFVFMTGSVNFGQTMVKYEQTATAKNKVEDLQKKVDEAMTPILEEVTKLRSALGDWVKGR